MSFLFSFPQNPEMQVRGKIIMSETGMCRKIIRGILDFKSMESRNPCSGLFHLFRPFFQSPDSSFFNCAISASTFFFFDCFWGFPYSAIFFFTVSNRSSFEIISFSSFFFHDKNTDELIKKLFLCSPCIGFLSISCPDRSMLLFSSCHINLLREALFYTTPWEILIRDYYKKYSLCNEPYPLRWSAISRFSRASVKSGLMAIALS